MTDVLGSFKRGQRLEGQGQSLDNLLSFIIQMERLVETKKQNKFYRELAIERETRMEDIFEFQKQRSLEAGERQEETKAAAEIKVTQKFQIGKLEKRIDTLLEKKRLSGQPRIDQYGDEVGKYPQFNKRNERLLKRHLDSLKELGVEYPESLLGLPFQGPTPSGAPLDTLQGAPETDSLGLFK